jgi:WD40 repeat protein
MTWSGDGGKLAVFANELYVWNAASGQLDKRLPLPEKPDAIALSPNGGILAAGAGKEISLWEVRTGRRLSGWLGHREWTIELEFSADGTTLASGSYDATAALWDVPSGRSKGRLTGHTKPVRHVTFSPDGRTLATRAVDDTLKLWNVQTGREVMAGEGTSSTWSPNFVGMRFSPDGSVMAFGLPSGQIRFLRAPSFAEIDAAELQKIGTE